jgi:putative ABC transport system permease protein
VGRNKRRTLITILTVFLGVVVCTATRGLLNGLQNEIRSNLTRKIHGDLQIHKRGYQDSLESSPYKMLIPATAPLTDFSFAPRLKIMGLLNHQKSQTTTPVMITGIDSQSEDQVCPRLKEAVQQGSMLDSTKEVAAPTITVDDELSEASGLDAVEQSPAKQIKAQGYHQIMVTPSLQRGMGAEVGDELIVLIADRDNMQQALVATLVGVVDLATPGSAPRMAWMDLSSLQRTLNVTGQASEIALRIPDHAQTQDMQKMVASKLPSDQVVETWLELGGFLRDAMALQDIIFSAVVAIMFAIVVAAIVNTSLMTVMERTREIGTLMALGYRRKHILFLFLVESAFIGGMGGILGLIVGGMLLTILNVHGIVMKLPGQVVPTTLYPTAHAPFLVFVLFLAVFAALISGIVPAYRASRLKPVKALSST